VPTSPPQEQVGVQLLQVNTEPQEEDYVSEFTFLNVLEDFTFHQNVTRTGIPSSWILLDSQSTVSVFNNARLLSNIRPSPRKLRVLTNGGTQTSTQMGTVTNFGDIWYNEASLADILSMAAVRKVCRITMDTSGEAAMHVHRKDGSTMTFREYQSGLYYYNASHHTTYPKTKDNSADYLFLTTVAGNVVTACC
jgi:hypothetical protein